MKRILVTLLFAGLVGCGQADQPPAETDAFDLAEALAQRGVRVPAEEAALQGLAGSEQATLLSGALRLEAPDLTNAADLEALLEARGLAPGTIDAQTLSPSAQEKEALTAALRSINP